MSDVCIKCGAQLLRPATPAGPALLGIVFRTVDGPACVPCGKWDVKPVEVEAAPGKPKRIAINPRQGSMVQESR